MTASARHGSLHAVEEEWPFRGAEAIGAGTLSRRQLRRDYFAVYPGVYVPRWVELSPAEQARAAWLWSRRRGVLAGLSASALHGAKWIDTDEPAELSHTNQRPMPALMVHNDRLRPDEVTEIDGMGVTTAARTAFDLGRRLPEIEAVQRIDALMNATGLSRSAVEGVAAQRRRSHGIGNLRRALELVDGGAESPYETLLRLILVRAGLPSPQTQVEVLDEFGCAVARVDMAWPEFRVAVEYDGAQQWTNPKQRRRDIERLAALEALGWIVIRVSSDMLRTSAVVVQRVRAAIASRS